MFAYRRSRLARFLLRLASSRNVAVPGSLTAAIALGLTIEESFFWRADEVIE
jgi:hypothetical protein